MRLLRVNIFEFRSIYDQVVAADGLIVLFGPNSAGKSSVLEAAEYLITRADIRRRDPADRYEVYAEGSVVFDLPGADLPGTEDAETYRWLLCGLYGDEQAWDWLGDGTSEHIRHLDLIRAREYLADLLAGSGAAGTLPERMLFARALFSSAAVFFLVDDAGIVLLVGESSLPRDVAEAAGRIAAEGGDDDPLASTANALLSQGSARLAVLADNTETRRHLAEAFPQVIVLDADPQSLSAELVKSLPRIHDRLWSLPRAPEPPDDPPPRYRFERVDDFLMYPGEGSTVHEMYEADPWVEGLSGDGDPLVAGPFGDYARASWHRVRHSLLAVAQFVEAEANNVAPDFVRGQGIIGIEVLPVSAWGSGLPRARATFTEDDGEPRDLKVVGAGTARWVAAAVRLACNRLEAGRQVITGISQVTGGNVEAAEEAVRAARRTPLTQDTVRLDPHDAPGFYIADEPETHLHPAAIKSVRDWLTQLAETAATVLIATHSPILLDTTSELTTRILVLRGENGTELHALTGGLADELEDASAVLGLSHGDLLLMTRLALFVEGRHDEIILTEWFADELSAAGIRVYPVHGVDNVIGLAESQIIAALGIRIATLSDDTSIPRVVSGKPKSRGDHAITRLLREAMATSVDVKAVGLNRKDILYYLDDGVCQQAAPSFPGWQAAEAAHTASGTHEDWKRWVAKQYGLSLSHEGIRTLAQDCRRLGKIPPELTGAITQLANYAAASGPEAIGRQSG